MRLHGTLTAVRGELHGTLSARSVIGAELYEGAYTVHSAAHEAQELPTANKRLVKNITVEAIPYNESENAQGGITVTIG